MAHPLPRQVRDQISEAANIEAAIKASQEVDPADDEDEVDVAPEATTTDVEEEEEVVEATGAGDTTITADAEVVDITPEPPVEDEGLEHKYKTLQGMYNSEKRKNSEMSGRIDGLEKVLSQMQTLRDNAADGQPKTVQEQAVAAAVSPEEVEEYGADFIDVMKRAALEAVSGEMQNMRDENTRLKEIIGGVGQKQEQTAQERFYSELDGMVSNWQTINQDPSFLDWLGEVDAYAGEPRQKLLRKAFDRSDAVRVARFFKGYTDENAAVQKATSTTAPAPAQQAAAPARVSLETLAAPGEGSSGSADNTGQSAARMWKESDIGAFYNAAREGRFKGKDDAYRQTEAQIQSAISEGRILVGQ
tara:strand:+ start:3703 stop:4782 length:1080 start_codon:yes stop_codon:yes gene_type:complete